jgi:hypothetical protein
VSRWRGVACPAEGLTSSESGACVRRGGDYSSLSEADRKLRQYTMGRISDFVHGSGEKNRLRLCSVAEWLSERWTCDRTISLVLC